MNVRLRYIGEEEYNRGRVLKPGKVYYFQLRQAYDLKIHLIDPRNRVPLEYSSLEHFLENWRILAIKKELKNAKLSDS